jgi:hypothetical protein
VKKVPLVGESERRTLEILDSVLAGTPYRAFSKVRVEDVIRAGADDSLWSGEESILARGHFDFVVCKRPSMVPTFAVEFDGPQHDHEPQRRRDRCKNRLCWRAELPLLRITHAEIAPHERISILEYMLQRFLAWPKELPSIDAEMQDRSPHLEPAGLADVDPSVIEDLVDDPRLDPTAVFDITHGYPGNARIARRLLNRFGIEVAQAPGSGFEFYNESPLRCAVLPSELSWPGDHVLRGAHFFVFEHTSDEQESFRWTGDGYEAVDARTLHRGHRQFSMRWNLPVDEDRSFVRHMVFADLPGIHMPHVARELCVYFALRGVEEWAEHALTLGTGSWVRS